MPKPVHFIFVTGATSGIGLGVTKKLLQLGRYHVIGIDKSDASGEINQNGYTHLKSDLTKFDETRDYINDFLSNSDASVKGLINAAGIMPSMILAKVDPRKAIETFSTNTVAPLYLSKLLLRHLSRAKPSFIINITSIAADINIPGEGVYSASKAALKVINEYMSIEFARFGISVNAIAPALLSTPLTSHLKQDQVDFMKSKQALHSQICINDVTDAVEFLLNSPPAITGNTIYVGGLIK